MLHVHVGETMTGSFIGAKEIVEELAYKCTCKLHSSSSELISVHCAPNLHNIISNMKMPKVGKCRAYISTFKNGDFDQKV